MSDKQALIAALAATASLPQDRAQSLPPGLYCNAEIAALERDRIFRNDWICIGRADQIPDVGDFLTTMVDTTPVLVVRQADGSIRAMANVCRHRLAQVAQGRGNCRGFICPYHGWSYALDGRLALAPRMSRDALPDDERLAPLACALWQGFLLVSLGAAPTPPDEALAALNKLVAPYHVGAMRTLRTGTEVWNTNWKILVENFLEAYHLPSTHPHTLTPFAPPSNVDMLKGHAAFHVYAHVMSGEAPPPLDPALAVPNPDLTPEVMKTALVGGVFPTLLFSVTWDWLFWLSLQPDGVNRVKVSHGLAAPLRLSEREPLPADHPNLYFMPLVDEVNQEDRSRVEAVQRGAESGFGQQSRLHAHETTLHSFARYLIGRLQD
jgi:choline monooxygenase